MEEVSACKQHVAATLLIPFRQPFERVMGHRNSEVRI
jgi:hypothetical protein